MGILLTKKKCEECKIDCMSSNYLEQLQLNSKTFDLYPLLV